MALAAGTTASCCSAMPSCLREDSQWLPDERMQWASFGRTSSGSFRGRSSNARFCVVSRMGGGGRGRGGGRSGGRGRGGGGRGRRGNRNFEPEVEDGPIMNENIRSPMLRLIGEDSQQIGVVPREDAFQRAERAQRDLVIIAADADPPVAKIMDYSKYKYEQQKKKRDQQKKAAASRVELKELKMRYNIDTHDYEVRLKQAKNFLKDGDKVKVFMPFRGREAQFKDLGMKLLKKFEEDIGEFGLLENKLADEGRTMFMTLAPNKIQLAKAEKKSRQSKAAQEAEDETEEEDEEEFVDEIVESDEDDDDVDDEDSAEEVPEKATTLSV